MISEIEKTVGAQISSERKESLLAEREALEQLQNGEAFVAWLRKEHDNLLDAQICRKGLALEAEAAPLLVKRFKTSALDCFIESAFYILAKADRQSARQLFREYREIRNPYARSMACLLFGEQGLEEAVPLLMEEYERFRREYPEESLHQGPLLALYLLSGKV